MRGSLIACQRIIAATAVLAATLLASTSALPAQQQQLPVEPRVQRVAGFDAMQAWLRIVRRHGVGAIDEAAKQAVTMTPTQQQQVIADLQLVRLLILQAGRQGVIQNSTGTDSGRSASADLRGRRLTLEQLAPLLGFTPEETNGPITASAIAQTDSPARLAIAKLMLRAAMLHTDVAMAPPGELPAPALTGARVAQSAVQLNDGRETAVLSVSIHYAIAREAIALVMPAKAATSLARQWYFATMAFLQAARDYDALFPHLETARIAVAGDPRAWLWSGAAYENMAAPDKQVAAGVTSARIDSPKLLLARAEAFYRHALELDAGCAECWLRLARVRQILGKADEAADLIARAAPKLTAPTSSYYAAMFAGRSAETLGKVQAARSSYVDAMSLYPQAQSPRLSLAALAFRDGEPSDALSGVRTMFVTSASNPQADPMFFYDVSLVLNWRELVAGLRKNALAFVEGR